MKARKIYEYDEEDERYEGEEGPFIKDDGWDEDALEDVGLIDWMENVERLAYEVRNARRGSYGVSGDTAEFLISDLEELKETLDGVIESMQDYLG